MRIKKTSRGFCALGAISALTLGMLATADAAEIVVNGGFEDPVGRSCWYDGLSSPLHEDPRPTGWADLSGSEPQLFQTKAGTYGEHTVETAMLPTAWYWLPANVNGGVWAFMGQGWAGGAQYNGTKQDLGAITAGTLYTVNADFARNSGDSPMRYDFFLMKQDGGTATVLAGIDEVTGGGVPAWGTWANYGFSYTATSADAGAELWIVFRMRYSGDNPRAGVDNVSVVTSTAPISTNCLMTAFWWGSYTGVVSESTVALTVPHGTAVTNLNPACTISPFATVSPASGSTNDFISPVVYTVTAQDETTTRAYTVTVTVADASTACLMTGFAVTNNGTVYNAAISGTAVSLTNLPYGTPLTALVPAITVSPFATVSPASGVAGDFSSAVNYTVTAQDGLNSNVYAVTVATVPPTTACDLLTFGWSGYTGLISGTNVTVHVTRNTDVTAAAPVCTVSTNATVSPLSGATNNFSAPVTYTVTAQDVTYTKAYRVTFAKDLANPGEILAVPPGLQVGDQYRLVFVTSTGIYGKAAAGGGTGPASIGDFNTFGANVANAVPALSALGTTWKAVVSTRSADGNTYVNAKANTGTDSGTGVPIYNLGGMLVSSDNTALWSSALVSPINVTELGTGPTMNFGSYYTVFTGTANNGNAAGGQSLCYPDGGYMMSGDPTTTSIITANNGAPDWISQLPGDPNSYQWNKMPIYVMSGIITIKPPKGTIISIY